MNSNSDLIIYQTPDGAINSMCVSKTKPSGFPKLTWPNYSIKAKRPSLSISATYLKRVN